MRFFDKRNGKREPTSVADIVNALPPTQRELDEARKDPRMSTDVHAPPICAYTSIPRTGQEHPTMRKARLWRQLPDALRRYLDSLAPGKKQRAFDAIAEAERRKEEHAWVPQVGISAKQASEMTRMRQELGSAHSQCLRVCDILPIALEVSVRPEVSPPLTFAITCRRCGEAVNHVEVTIDLPSDEQAANGAVAFLRVKNAMLHRPMLVLSRVANAAGDVGAAEFLLDDGDSVSGPLHAVPPTPKAPAPLDPKVIQ